MKYIRKLISIFLALCITVSCMTGLTITVSAENDPRIIVSLGDSYSSGEGLEPYYGQSNKVNASNINLDWLAHRSTKAWGSMLTLGGKSMVRDTNWFFAAASGAETKHLTKVQNIKYNFDLNGTNYSNTSPLPAQLSILDGLKLTSNDYVIITIGGNDIGFVGIMTTAVTESAAALQTAINNKKNSFNTEIKNNLIAAYQAVAKSAKDATIIVAGYPYLIAAKKDYFSAEKADIMKDAVDWLNGEIKTIVNDQRNNGGMKIHFVDVRPSFEGHEAYSSDPYINELSVGWGTHAEDIDKTALAWSGSFHPNASGAAAYAAAVQTMINTLENPFTVTFDSTGGTAVASQKVVSGDKAVEPTDPTRDNCTFAGWYANENCTGDPFDFANTAITENKTLYAKWTETLCTVTVNNGTGSGDYAAGASVTITANTPAEVGKQFMEWTGTDGLVFTSGNKNTATATFTMPANAVTVTATYGGASSVSAPTFSPDGGTYTGIQNVTVSCATGGATIRYTTDGTEPTETSPVYSSPVTVSKNTTIKAISILDSLPMSKVSTASYTITIPVTSVTVWEIDTLTVGQIWMLKATVTPDNATDKTVTWTSDNPSIVSVDNGTITANNVGTTRITAAAGGKTASFNVTVKENQQYIMPVPIPTPTPVPVPVPVMTPTPAADTPTPVTDTPTPVTDTVTPAADATTYTNSNNNSSSKAAATVKSGKVELKWEKIKNAESYTVYIMKNDKWTALKTVKGTRLDVTGLKEGNNYEFLIKHTVDGKLSETNDSSKVSVNYYASPAVKLTSSNGSISIEWEKVTGATDYKVYKYVKGKLRLVTKTSKGKVLITDTTAGKEYSYVVSAFVNDQWTKITKSDIVTVKAK